MTREPKLQDLKGCWVDANTIVFIVPFVGRMMTCGDLCSPKSACLPRTSSNFYRIGSRTSRLVVP